MKIEKLELPGVPCSYYTVIISFTLISILYLDEIFKNSNISIFLLECSI